MKLSIAMVFYAVLKYVVFVIVKVIVNPFLWFWFLCSF